MIRKLAENFKFHREKWMFWMIAAAGLLLRFEYLREFSAEIHCAFAIGPDVQEYHERALEILNGVIFPGEAEIHAPFYSFLLALTYAFSGASVIFARFFQLVLNWGAYVALAALIGRLSGRTRLSRIFLTLAMFTPVLFFHQAELVSESMLVPLTAGCFWMLYAADKDRRWYCGAGAAAGMLILTHGLLIFFAAGEVLWFTIRKQWQKCGLFAAGIAMTVLPVIAAKSCYYGKFTGIQENSGYNLWIGNNPEATGGCYLRPGRMWQIPLNTARAEAVERRVSENRVFLEKIVEFYLDNPVNIAVMPLKKLALLLSPFEAVSGADPEYFIRLTPVQKYGSGMMAAVLILGAAGIFFAVKKREKGFIHFYILAASLAVGLLLTVVSGRYRQGMMPGVLLLAALGAYYTGRKVWAVIVPCVLGGALLIPPSAGGIKRNCEAASIMGEAYFRLKNYEKAEELLLIAERGIDHPERFHNMFGVIAEARGDFDTAIVRYTSALKHVPDDADTLLNLGHMYFYHFPEKRGEALGLIKQALEVDETLPSAYDMLGQHQAQQGDFAGALILFETALKYQPDSEIYQKKVNICRQILSAKE